MPLQEHALCKRGSHVTSCSPPLQEARFTKEYKDVSTVALSELLERKYLMVSPRARPRWREKGKCWNRMENLMGMLHLNLQEQSS